MTRPLTLAERLQDVAILESVSQVPRAKFKAAGLEVEEKEVGLILVAGRYLYTARIGHWRDRDTMAWGHGWHSLIRHIKREAEANRCAGCHPVPAIVRIAG